MKPLNEMSDAELVAGVDALQPELVKLQEAQGAMTKERHRRTRLALVEAKREELKELEKFLAGL